MRIANGRFRSDLYGSLPGHEMLMPPLRDRAEDIGSIIAALLVRPDVGAGDGFGSDGVVASHGSICFQSRAAFALFTCPYPMMVRELGRPLPGGGGARLG